MTRARLIREIKNHLGVVSKGFAWVDDVDGSLFHKGKKISRAELKDLQRSNEVLIWKETAFTKVV